MSNERFRGFDSPNYTPIPDQFFDELMVDLSASELRVLLYIMRRTLGFKKRADAISLKQIISGITTKDGRRVDRGAGLSHTAVKTGIKGLIDRGVITAAKIQAESGEYETNVYELVFKQAGNDVAYPGQRGFLPAGNDVALQETEQQETESQEEEIKKPPTIEELARRSEEQARRRAEIDRLRRAGFGKQ